MARINIEECWWTDPRRSALILTTGSEMHADWVAIRAWRLAQEFWKHDRKLVPKELFDILPFSAELIRVGLAVVRTDAERDSNEPRTEVIYVRGSSQYLDWVREKREQASDAGKKSAEARRNKTGSAQPKTRKPRTKPERTPNAPRTESNGAEPSDSGSLSDSVSASDSGEICGEQSLTVLEPAKTGEAGKGGKDPKPEPITRAVWDAYSSAYFDRYGIEPARSAKLNSQMATFVKAIGADDAPHVARFYVGSNDAWYVKQRHDFGACCSNAQKLRTDWKLGATVSMNEARSLERRDEIAKGWGLAAPENDERGAG